MSEHKIKGIVSDFDGTILKGREQEVSPCFFETLHQVMEKGIFFVAASGRQYPNLKWLMTPVANEISYISENGAVVVCDGKIIHKSVMEETVASELIADMLEVSGADVVASSDSSCYMNHGNMELARHLLKEVKYHLLLVEDYKDIKEELVKISMFFKEGIPDQVIKEFKEKYQDRFQIVDAGNNWLDFTNLDASKGHALKILANYKGFSVDEMVAFGDSENDITMLQEAGLSYAMSSAKEHIKKFADRECESVGDTLVKLFL